MLYITETNRQIPAVLARTLDKYQDRIHKTRKPGTDNDCLAVDYGDGFVTPSGRAWDILLADGWLTQDETSSIIESSASQAAFLIRTATFEGN